MSTPTLHEHLHTWLKGYQPAVEFCSLIFKICHRWDDLIDRDTPISNQDINQAFWMALVDLPRNPFYTQHFHTLNPVIQTGILNWLSSTKLERSTVYEHRLLAFSLRSIISDVVAMSALIIGGAQWAEDVHMAMQVANEESLTDYLAGLKEAP